MNVAALNHARRQGPFASLASSLRSAGDDFAKWRMYRRTVSELSKLDERELRDLGLGGGGIRAAARAAVYG